MGATPTAPKSRRRSPAQPRRAATAAAPRPQIAPDERIGVAHLTAEYWPFARTGGLGEAVSGLATCQAAAGLPTTVFMPLYQIVRETTPSLERTGSALAIPLGGHTERAWLDRTPPGPGGGPQVFFIEHPDFFDRAGVYGDNGAGYPDHARRFAVFFLGALKGGMAHSNVVVTVSPSHAEELRTAEGGFGLHDRFTALGDRLVGILNGIDPDLWNPETDPELTGNYSSEDLSGKRRCKAALQRAYGLAQRAHTPLFGMSARMVSQKGLDLVLGADLLGTTEAQFIFLGAGEHRYHEALGNIAAAAPDRVAVEFMFTDRVEHRLLAGADALLMPSLYEPCGLTQMRAQHYGAVPVARRVGGLKDSIIDGVSGFLFDEYSPAALAQAIRRAIDAYADRTVWRKLVRGAMAQQFGWHRSGEQYFALYGRAPPGRSASLSS